MASFKRLSLVLMTTCAGAALSACDGAVSVGSPGEGVIVVPGPTPTPAPSPTPTPTPTPTGGPAASCPSGTTDVGVVGNYRGCRLPSLVSGNTTLAKIQGVAYEINGRVDVGQDVGGGGTGSGGAILTIQPGVVIYANANNAENDFMVVNRGSRLYAEGTETKPIIFTSMQNVQGTANDDSQGQWGGIILAGRAPVSNCNLQNVTGGAANCENVVEGTGTALYGGNAPNDNSGTIRYVQFRFSGTTLAPDVELQSLTLGGTGYGTTIDHIQSHNSSDDGIEVLGGRTNLKYVVITGADDDGFDTDVGWNGYVQFLLTIQKPSNSQSDNYSTEIDSNNAEDALPRQKYHLANFTFVHTSTSTNAAMRIRGGADTQMVNGIVTTPQACMTIVAGTTDNGGVPSTIRPAGGTGGVPTNIEESGPPQFNSVYFACGATKFATTTVNGITISAADQQAAITAAPSSNVKLDGTAADALTNTYLPGPGPQAMTAFNPASLNPPASTGLVAFFVNANYLGAINPAGDTWYQGWTCNSNRANFGSASKACTALPA